MLHLKHLMYVFAHVLANALCACVRAYGHLFLRVRGSWQQKVEQLEGELQECKEANEALALEVSGPSRSPTLSVFAR